MNRYLSDYLAGVQSPNASGFEHLNTLLVRDKLFEQYQLHSMEEKAELLNADYQLIEQSLVFVSQLEQITTLEHEREQRQVPPEQWWRYLDIIAHLPFAIQLPESSNPAATLTAYTAFSSSFQNELLTFS